jgi:plasmid stabilization system protein ParE
VSEVVLSELAEADLKDILVFVAQDNAAAADRLIDEIHQKCRMLAATPKAGRQRPGTGPFHSEASWPAVTKFSAVILNEVKDLARSSARYRSPGSYARRTARDPSVRHEGAAIQWMRDPP